MAVINYMKTGVLDHGAITQLAKTMARLKMTRPFIVTDAGVRAAGLLDKAAACMTVSPAGVYDATLSNPQEAQAVAAAALYRESGADGLIAIGGGSPMDLAKMAGLIATHEGPWGQYGVSVGGMRRIGATPPLIAIPTTAGTGSEVSAGALITLETGLKELFISSHLIPDVAICDPDLTLDLPAGLTAATGMDAVTHCIEAILSTAQNPVADAIGLDGLYQSVGAGMLRRAVADGADKDARYAMMLASYEGAMAFVKSLGAVHALSHGAGRLTDIRPHHGTLNAIWLPHVLRFNASAPGAEAVYDRLRRAMNLAPGADVADAVAALNADIGLPQTLSELGLTADHGAGVVACAMKDFSTATNPRPLTQGDYEQLYAAAL